MKRLAIVAALLGAVVAPAPALAEPRRITLADAIALASSQNVEATVGREQITASEARVRAARAQRLPTLGIKGNVFVWNEAIEIELAPGTSISGRDQVTASLDVTIAQPISGALVIGKLVELERRGVDARRAELEQTKLDLAYRAAEAYLGALQAATLRDVAQTSVTQIEANLTRAEALEAAGILFDVDLLRLQAQRDALIQQVLEAQSTYDVARRGLALLLGLPDGTELELAPVDTSPPAVPGTEAEAAAAARRKRPELRAAEAQLAQARLGIAVQRANYYPNVVAIGQYSHTEGQGAFAIKDSAFVGLTVDWNLWDWGQRKAGVDEARANARAAGLSRDALADAMALDARSKWVAASTRRQTLAVTASGLRAAEEAHRLQQVRFDAGAATTTDVIDAETEVARARAQATIARYQYLIAWMALVRAVGDRPSFDAPTPAPP